MGGYALNMRSICAGPEIDSRRGAYWAHIERISSAHILGTPYVRYAPAHFPRGPVTVSALRARYGFPIRSPALGQLTHQ
jgi:hypothetical protein